MITYIIDNEICVKGATSLYKQFLMHKLTFDNPEYAKKVKLGKWIGNTPKEITLYREVGDDLYVPYGVKETLLKHNEPYQIEDRIPYQEELSYPSVPLRPYQGEAVATMLDCKGGILQSRAGSGKTQMGLAIASCLKKKTLWLTHTKDLLTQSKARAEQYFDPDTIGTITEGKVNVGSHITFATIQTMAKIDLPLYKYEWEVVIIDECHRVSGSSTRVRLFQKVLENLAPRYQFGLSATLHRADGLIDTTFALIGDINYVVPDSAVEEYIMPVSIHPVFTGIEESEEYLNYDGMIDYAKLISYITRSKKRNKIIADDLIFNSYNSNLILSDRIEHLHTIYDLLPPSFQKRSAFIDGTMTNKTQKELRVKYLQDMRDGKLNFLFATYQLAKEGLDIPSLDRVYMTTPQKDYAIIVQSVGRAMRKADDKTDPIIYDYVDDIDFLLRRYNKRKAIYKKEGYTII